MSIFTKARVKVAQSNTSRQTFNKTHVTTSDFLQLSCAYSREMVPNQKLEVSCNTFARLLPLPCPTFGDAEIKHHAFFVPWRTVMPSFEDFITDTPHVQANSGAAQSGLVPYVHRVDLNDLSECLTTSQFSSLSTSADYDFPRISNSGTTYYKLNARGRAIYKILCALGYPYIQERSDATNYVSALPLLGLARIYADWFYPSAYVGDPTYNLIMSVLKHDECVGYTLSQQDILRIFLLISHVSFDADYFTSAFDNPAGPNNGLFSSFNVPDISLTFPKNFGSSTSVTSTGVGVDTNGTPFTSSNIANSTSSFAYNFISQYLLDSLHSLSDYMKRHQLVGSRAIDRFLARFGVSLGTEKTDRSYHLGTYVVPVQFGAVMSNSDTEGAALGDYAGQGFAYNNQNPNGNFSFSSNEYGMFYITTSIIPKIGYVQGIDRSILHLNKLDFWTPEFDALGTQPISKAELYYDPKTDDIYSEIGYNALFNEIFGFTPRYAEYKTDKDLLTGDFRLPRLSVAGDTSSAWHLFRLFNFRESSEIVHSREFVQPNTTDEAKNFDRIFNNTTDDADHFVLVHRFLVNSVFPGKALFDTYDFDAESGKSIVVESGGVRMN